MADEIKTELGVQVELIAGGGGIFDVVADGDMVFSKHKVGRFPESGEVLQSLKSKTK